MDMSNLNDEAVIQSSDAADARPDDASILQQQNEIRAASSSVPYLADVETLNSLKSEYESGSPVFVLKIEQLAASYSHLRRTRGDGNCFYRAFIFAYLEGLLLKHNLTEAKRFIDCLQEWKRKLVESHFQELVFEDALDLLVEQVSAIGREKDPMTLSLLLTNLRDDMVSNMIVMFLRLVTSAAIQQREEFFTPFIMGMYDESPSASTFCQKYVEPMGEESDHVHIVALTDALQVPVEVLYLDRSGEASTSVDVDTYQFIPEECPPERRKPFVSLLYRPGHYDILYPTS